MKMGEKNIKNCVNSMEKCAKISNSNPTVSYKSLKLIDELLSIIIH